MTRAPYHTEIIAGAAAGSSQWITAQDGVRLRVTTWTGPAAGAPETPDVKAKGTVLLFTGRTEFAEKYAGFASHVLAADFCMISTDWRGQGLSDRVMDDPLRGHVGVFSDYQMDVAALLDAARAADLPQPYFLVAHSMGGAIGLRALMDGLPVKAAAFSAPMWGIAMSPPLRPVAWGVSKLAGLLGISGRHAPGTLPGSFLLQDGFEGNTLTRDAQTWDHMKMQITTVPELELGGPSIHWLGEALCECADLAREPAPNVPCLTLLGDNERIVDPARIHTRMAQWPGGTLHMLKNAEHEVLMEAQPVRDKATTAVLSFFDGHC